MRRGEGAGRGERASAPSLTDVTLDDVPAPAARCCPLSLTWALSLIWIPALTVGSLLRARAPASSFTLRARTSSHHGYPSSVCSDPYHVNALHPSRFTALHPPYTGATPPGGPAPALSTPLLGLDDEGSAGSDDTDDDGDGAADGCSLDDGSRAEGGGGGREEEEEEATPPPSQTAAAPPPPQPGLANASREAAAAAARGGTTGGARSRLADLFRWPLAGSGSAAGGAALLPPAATAAAGGLRGPPPGTSPDNGMMGTSAGMFTMDDMAASSAASSVQQQQQQNHNSSGNHHSQQHGGGGGASTLSALSHAAAVLASPGGRLSPSDAGRPGLVWGACPYFAALPQPTPRSATWFLVDLLLPILAFSGPPATVCSPALLDPDWVPQNA